MWWNWIKKQCFVRLFVTHFIAVSANSVAVSSPMMAVKPKHVAAN
jgi:hypothetical protein